jgi:hypothetical protein
MIAARQSERMVNDGFRNARRYGFEMVDTAWNPHPRSSIENLRENRIDRMFGEFSHN